MEYYSVEYWSAFFTLLLHYSHHLTKKRIFTNFNFWIYRKRKKNSSLSQIHDNSDWRSKHCLFLGIVEYLLRLSQFQSHWFECTFATWRFQRFKRLIPFNVLKTRIRTHVNIQIDFSVIWLSHHIAFRSIWFSGFLSDKWPKI